MPGQGCPRPGNTTLCLSRCRLPGLAWLLEALCAIGSTGLANHNHLRTNVITDTLETRDEALGTLAFTATSTFSTATYHNQHIKWVTIEDWP